MNKELIINAAPGEISIAMFEDKQLVEYNTEHTKSGFAVGDIYLGRVKKIMPGLNAAFVNIGYEKDAFIHFLDLGTQFDTLNKFTSALAKGNRKIKFETLRLEKGLGKTGKISSYLSSGQHIVVQIAKEAISTKGPRLTSDISIAGRHVVLIPFNNKISLSQKIRSSEERKRLKQIVESVLPHNYGVIVRTAAVGQQEADIAADIQSLVAKWESVIAKLRGADQPMLLLEEMNRTTSILRDLLNGSFSSIHIDNSAVYDEVREYIQTIAPDKEKIVKLYRGKTPIFDNFDVTRQIKSLFSKYVSLRKGAYLIIEHTEALHVVDVNSGNRAKVDNDQEQTAMEVNLNAAAEIARQLRLRDMGGIIVIDFIDLHKGENRTALVDAMHKLMANDRAKHTILPLSKFGLMQITRQRVRPETKIDITEVCPTCSGTGKIAPTMLLDKNIENQIAYFAQDQGRKYIKLVVSPFVAAFLKRGLISLRMKWQTKYKCRIHIEEDPSMGFIETKFLDSNGKVMI